MVVIVGIVCLGIGLGLGYLIGRCSDPMFALMLALAYGGSACGGPLEAAQAALEDARRLPPGEAVVTRYLSLYSDRAEQRAETRKGVAFWANSLSTIPDITLPRVVTAELLAVRLIDYSWQAKTWDGFAFADPYFTVRIVTPWPGGVYRPDGKNYPRGAFNETSVASAPWIDPAIAAELYQRTASIAPILRADWWMAQIAIQADRKVGYYDLIGVGKKRADFEKLVGMDRAAAQRNKKEISAVVDRSIVALHNRQIYRFATLNGPYWETRDVKANDGKRNALRLLNGDYGPHDAEEIYGTLPNGLFAFFLSDGAGNRADSAPDFIASDGGSRGPDRRVSTAISCVRCHVEGIRPIDCWFRRTYAAPDALNVLDPARSIRLRQLYASDLDRFIRRDQADYAEALRLTNGLTPGDNSKVVAAIWDRYIEQTVSLEDAARDVGRTPEELAAAIRSTLGVDPILFSLTKQPIRREHYDEAFSVLMGLLK